MITAGCILEAERKRKRKKKKKKKRRKREPDTRLIISIFHSNAPDEKERGATSGDYKRPLLFRRPICFPFFLLPFSSFFFCRHRHHRCHGGSLPNGPFSSSDWREPAATFRARIYLSRSWTPRGQREINNSASPVGIAADHFRSFPFALISHPRERKACLLRTLFNRSMLMNTFPGCETAPLKAWRCLLLKITSRNGYLSPDLCGTFLYLPHFHSV